MQRRWDTDERGRGVATGAAYTSQVGDLLTALQEPEWIAEDPDHHLLPHLQRACATPGGPWRLTATAMGDDGVYTVNLDWQGAGGSRELRADVFALIGQVAEATTHVRQAVAGGRIEFRAATGMLAGDSPFAGHGHLIALRIGGPSIVAIIATLHWDADATAKT